MQRDFLKCDHGWHGKLNLYCVMYFMTRIHSRMFSPLQCITEPARVTQAPGNNISTVTPGSTTTAPLPKSNTSKTSTGPPKIAAEPTPPSTPINKRKVAVRKDVTELLPGQRSPYKMANGTHCYGCDHENLQGFRSYEKNWCTEVTSQKENCPKSCADCHLHFYKDKAKVFAKDKVVRACPNATNHRDHECVYALCQDCWVKKTEEKGRPSKRARRAIAYSR